METKSGKKRAVQIVCIVIVLFAGIITIIGSGGGGGGSSSDYLDFVNSDEQNPVQPENNGDIVTINSFETVPLTVDAIQNTESFRVLFDISFNNPEFLFYVADVYLIDTPTTLPSDWEEGRYVGTGDSLYQSASNTNKITASQDYICYYSENILYYEKAGFEHRIPLDQFGAELYLLLVGYTEKFNTDTLSKEFYEAHKIIPLNLELR